MTNVWLAPSAVLTYARQDGDIAPDDPAVVSATDGAAAVVQRLVDRIDWTTVTDATTVPADVMLGAIMLAWRFYQRRNSPLGVSGYQDFGTSPLLRHDPDIARLFGIGPEGAFVFGSAGVTSAEAAANYAAEQAAETGATS